MKHMIIWVICCGLGNPSHSVGFDLENQTNQETMRKADVPSSLGPRDLAACLVAFRSFRKAWPFLPPEPVCVAHGRVALGGGQGAPALLRPWADPLAPGAQLAEGCLWHRCVPG